MFDPLPNHNDKKTSSSSLTIASAMQPQGRQAIVEEAANMM